MGIFKKLLVIIIITIMITAILGIPIHNVNGDVVKEPVKVDILLYRFDDAYISLVRQAFEEIQNKNKGKVEFTFYDGKDNQSIQNESLNEILEKGETDLILLNLVDTKSTKEAINEIKEKNIPVILFNREPVDIDAIASYNKSYFVGTEASEAGILQGKILVDKWNKDKEVIDKNKDDIMQYVMLMGEQDNLEAIQRTKYSVSTINNAGIKTQELALRICNWDEDTAKDTMEKLFLQYGERIEAIISNNDSMAIGAIETLQKYGYNQGDKNKAIPVVGVDAIPAAQELIKKGFMTGSVLQDPKVMAEAIYSIGMNLVYGRKPLDGTEYKFDSTGVAVRIPYKEYIETNK
ncbi:galactose ABC transporter substrate-binding protein [Clostridium sp.]|uniref:galactose ABC transporter substrate-binding protein n=1 Tax=Clostridium sp. TaxID=1506 RepID=UPI0028485E2D|nr:galactose ABC transporter substrate-binding protein [Clostridium sp.]MDR3598586.1 galactose ABC transporter substrate-binding protein [Clostridium sp.]